MKINIYDLNAKIIKDRDVVVGLNEGTDVADLIGRYVKIMQINKTQGTSNAKTKSEVSGGGKKPWKQKGTGRARSGSSRSPLWVGGGVSHGPRAFTKSASMNKKMKNLAFKAIIFDKLSNSKVIGLVYDEKEASTKKISKFLMNLELQGKFVMIHDNNQELYRSSRNIKNVDVKSANDISVFEILNADYLVFEEKSLSIIEKRIK